MYLVHVPFGFLEKGEEIHPMDDDGNILLDKTTNHVDIWKVQYFSKEEYDTSQFFVVLRITT
jgi:hypothetical protein